MEDFKAQLGEAFVSEALNPTHLYSLRRNKSLQDKPETNDLDLITSVKTAPVENFTKCDVVTEIPAEETPKDAEDDEQSTQSLAMRSSLMSTSVVTIDSGISEENMTDIVEDYSTDQQEGGHHSDLITMTSHTESTGDNKINVNNIEEQQNTSKKRRMANTQTNQNEDIQRAVETHAALKSPQIDNKKEITLTPEEFARLEAEGELEGIDIHGCVITLVSETETTVERTVVLTDSGKEEILDEKEIGKTQTNKVEVKNEDSDTESASQGTTDLPPSYLLERSQFNDNDQDKIAGSDITEDNEEPQEIQKSDILELNITPEMEIQSPWCELEQDISDQRDGENTKPNIKATSSDISEIKQVDNEPSKNTIETEEIVSPAVYRQPEGEEPSQDSSNPRDCETPLIEENLSTVTQDSGNPVAEEDISPSPGNDEPAFSMPAGSQADLGLFKSCILTKSVDLQGFMNFPAEEWVFVSFDKDTSNVSEQLILLSTELYKVTARGCCTIQ